MIPAHHRLLPCNIELRFTLETRRTAQGLLPCLFRTPQPLKYNLIHISQIDTYSHLPHDESEHKDAEVTTLTWSHAHNAWEPHPSTLKNPDETRFEPNAEPMLSPGQYTICIPSCSHYYCTHILLKKALAETGPECCCIIISFQMEIA